MTTAESFEWAMKVADAEQVADAARADGFSEGEAQRIEQNVLLYPGMLKSLRERLRWDDTYVARAMIDPHGFADKILEDSQHPERWDRPIE